MDFIREKIKEKPISKKRLLIKLGTAALCGLVFAAVVCLVLAIFLPILQKDNTPSTQNTEPETESIALNTQETKGTESSESDNIIIPPDFSLSISDYQVLQDELYKIGNEVNKSIVTVTGVDEELGWLENDFETAGKGSGLIVAEDGNYLYILTERKVILDAESIRVSFVDKTGAPATMRKYDANTGLAILTVEKRQIASSTKSKIQIAKLGNSYAMSNGAIVIAVGSPQGANYSILTGNITSVENEIATRDKNYSVFTTDIIASENASGVVVNTLGEVVGIVMQSFSGSQDMSTLTAVVVDELKAMVEMLINGKDLPYIGLYISTVTADISKDYDIPKGVFIREVEADSPAMRAGLQSGDVIVKMNGENISTDMVYSNKISQLIPGTTCELIVMRQNGNKYYEVTCEVEIGILE